GGAAVFSVFPYTTLFRSTLRRRLRGLIPEILDYWLITVGYAGVHEVTFEDAPEWVDLEPTEDSDFLRYRDPESLRWRQLPIAEADRKSTRLNSSHVKISY